MNRLRRLYLPHLRLIITIAVDFLSLAELLRPRTASAHYIGDQHQTNNPWWPFEPPTRQRTPFVIASSLLGMTAVIAASLTAASHHAEGLLMIPVYGIFLVIVLSRRQTRLNMAA